jgi:hypothetical protein
MKRNTRSEQKTIIVLILIIWMIGIIQCNQSRHKQEKSPYHDVQVNPAFVTNPPLVTSVDRLRLYVAGRVEAKQLLKCGED